MSVNLTTISPVINLKTNLDIENNEIVKNSKIEESNIFYRYASIVIQVVIEI